MKEVPVDGTVVNDNNVVAGMLDYYSTTTDSLGGAQISGASVPSYWNHFAHWPEWCGWTYYMGPSGGSGYNYEQAMYWTPNQQVVPWNCVENDLSFASTRFAILGNLPSSLTLSGLEPFSTQYGMPELDIYGGGPTLMSTIAATSVSPDGSTATFPFPNSLPQSGYGVALSNQIQGGATEPAGFNFLSIASSQSISGNPFGAAVASLTKMHSTRNLCNGTRTVTSTTVLQTLPVISLYSLNQVLINGSAVSVGSNPTAVAAYASNPVLVDNSTDCELDTTITSGFTGAVVTNSGDNSVSLLDVVNRAVLFNVIVGNHPVAVAVSSDGSTAYVANYADSTVSQVNLGSGSVSSTVAVAGPPTSVSLTSAGMLWVGGQGFITEIDTSSMAVVATQTLGAKSIIALGYSDSVGQLVATSTDGSGQIYSEDINPSSVSSGGTYAPLASHSISTLGTYSNSNSGASTMAYTSTLAFGAPVSSALVGAPPLVVQDGWAVISATPTGFTVTDITGHVVLISEVTPSPVAAIAVDTNLSVAYLTLPDSNIVLQVPLPGVN